MGRKVTQDQVGLCAALGRRQAASRQAATSFVTFNINLFTLTQIALFFSLQMDTQSAVDNLLVDIFLNTLNWLKKKQKKTPKKSKTNQKPQKQKETSNLILPPLYYGMHRFQTLLRKRQQTLCLRSFLNDAVTACDPRWEGKKKNEPKKR